MRWEDDLILDSTSEELRSRVLQRVAERAQFAGWLPSMGCRNLSHFLSMHAPRHGIDSCICLLPVRVLLSQLLVCCVWRRAEHMR